jgi:hypothetical protein
MNKKEFKDINTIIKGIEEDSNNKMIREILRWSTSPSKAMNQAIREYFIEHAKEKRSKKQKQNK